MRTFNSWYEVSLILRAENRKIHIVSLDSLEEAEEKKKELEKAGLTPIVEEWNLHNDIPILMGEI